MESAATPEHTSSDVLADTAPVHLPHAATECSKCFEELQSDRFWWAARPAGSRLVGLVVARDDMPPVVQQRDDMTRFGVPIEGFRHPAPEVLESWQARLERFADTLGHGDILVVANTRALGSDADHATRTVADLRGRGVMVKVLSHDARHLANAAH